MNRQIFSGLAAAIALLASVPAFAQQDRAAEEQQRLQILGRYVFVIYGAMLCDDADTAIGLRSAMSMRMELRPGIPCHASNGGWAALQRFSTSYGTGFVQFKSGESGWVASVNGFLTCREYDQIRFRVPGAPPTPAFCGH